MPTVHERIAEVEEQLLGLVNVAKPTQAMRDRIHRLVTLVARASEVHYRHAIHGYDRASCERKAMKRYPLPPKRVLREEPDPNTGYVFWRWNGRLEYRPTTGSEWIALVSNQSGRVFAPYDERIDLWHSLKHEPHREVPDEGDE